MCIIGVTLRLRGGEMFVASLNIFNIVKDYDSCPLVTGFYNYLFLFLEFFQFFFGLETFICKGPIKLIKYHYCDRLI